MTVAGLSRLRRTMGTLVDRDEADSSIRALIEPFNKKNVEIADDARPLPATSSSTA